MENVNKQLLNALKRLLECYKMADHRDGYCCCGSPMDRHDDPMNCGHSSVDAGEYNASLIIDDVESVIATSERAQQADNQSEEAAYIKWMCETFPTVYDPPLARLWIEQKHVSFLAWMERAKQPPAQQQAEPVALDDATIIGIAKPYRQEVCHIDVYSFNKREFLDVARRIIDAAQPPAVAVPEIKEASHGA